MPVAIAATLRCANKECEKWINVGVELSLGRVREYGVQPASIIPDVLPLTWEWIEAKPDAIFPFLYGMEVVCSEECRMAFHKAGGVK